MHPVFCPFRRSLKRLFCAIGAAALFGMVAACAPGGTPQDVPSPSASTGQVAGVSAPLAATHYAASRLAEQATFGPSPQVVADIRRLGVQRWIDEQLALPATALDLSYTEGFPDLVSDTVRMSYETLFPNAAVGGRDQLRLRMAWALSQVVVVSDRSIDFYGMGFWKDLLVQRALGNYADLLYHATLNPAMGRYLDNADNRPKSTQCPQCAPNENYARELLQLFSVGVVKLNLDGTVVKDAQGRPVETYSQQDVEELARVLTGWEFDPQPSNRPSRNWANWGRPMTASTWRAARDSGAKTVMGHNFPAGLTAAEDLRRAVDFLVRHPNTAPFMATRLIQHLVKSNPTPAYVQRVASVFRDNGQGQVGDLKAVARAVLLDPEARAGDVAGAGRKDDGKIREPFLFHTALWRGLGCKQWPARSNWTRLPTGQRPFNAESVFSFYAPTDRAPGSNILAPEQRVINSQELSDRLGLVSWATWDNERRMHTTEVYDAAGCDVRAMLDAYAASPNQYYDFVAQRFFRGQLPPTLRNALDQQVKLPTWNINEPHQGPMILLGFALTSPFFGTMK